MQKNNIANNTDTNINYIVKKIEATGSTFILSSPCLYTLLNTVKQIAKNVFTKHLNSKDQKDLIAQINTRIDQNLFPDFIIIKPDGKEIKVEQIKPILPILNHLPMEGAHRIIVIQDAHRLNKHTANRLLKPMEEPPKNTSFILLTTNISRLLPTILSRSEILRIPPIDKETILKIEQRDIANIDFLYDISGLSKYRLDFFIENNDFIMDIKNFIESKSKSFMKIQSLSDTISKIADHDITKQEHIIYAIIKILQKKDYNLAKKVLEVFEGIYFNTKDTIIFENIFLELSK